jgi:riboflavin synthase
MFTGIIEHMGVLEPLEQTAAGGRLKIRAPELASSLQVGHSVAVNGCCLTIVEVTGDVFSADLSGETLRRTSFGKLAGRARVNLEQPLVAGKELGGHFVQGHVDGIGQVARFEPEGENWWLDVRVLEELHRYIAWKGSLAVDGISLTVAAWNEGIAGFAIIPFTYTHTNLQGVRAGDPVNLECDILAKYIEGLLGPRGEQTESRLTIEKLVEEGF